MAARAKLKQIQKSLKEEDYDAVVAQTKELLKEEKGQGQSVYGALVFAGVALTKLGRDDEAEKVGTSFVFGDGADQGVGVPPSDEAFPGPAVGVPRRDEVIYGKGAVGQAGRAVQGAGDTCRSRVRPATAPPSGADKGYAGTTPRPARALCRSCYSSSKTTDPRKR
jgi:hypothetical protein